MRKFERMAKNYPIIPSDRAAEKMVDVGPVWATETVHAAA